MVENDRELYEIAAIINQRGFHTAMQRGHRLACALNGGRWGIGGPGVWLANWDQRWFVSTWTPRIYILPFGTNSAKVVEIVIAVLSMSPSAGLYDLPDSIRLEYCLSEISLAEYTVYATRGLQE